MNRTCTVCLLHAFLLLALPAGLVAIAQPGAKGTRFAEHLIKGGYKYSYGIAAADLDGDKRPNLVVSPESGANEVRWWRSEESK